MSIDPKKSKLSAIKGVDPVSEEAFGWVVVDQSPVQRQSDTDDGAAQVSSAAVNADAGTSKFVVSADALARIMSVEDQPAPNALHGAEAPEQRQHSDSGASLFNSGFGVHGLSIPAHAGLTSNRGSSNTITAVPGARPGEVAGHIATGSSVQGPSVAALAAIGREDHPLALHISAVDALHHRGTVDLVVTGMPPGATLTHGHSGPNHSWILPHNTDLTSLSLIPTPDWSGSGTLHITGTQTNGSTANAVLPFQIGPLPDGAIIGGIATGSTIEDTKTSVSGDLTVVDPDPGEAAFVSHSYTLGHGVLAIDSAGHWTFNLDNNSAAVQSLAVGEVIHEMVAVQTVDGTSHSISLTISGRNDGPVLLGSVASAVEDGAPVSGQMAATDADRGDQLAFAAVGPLPAGLTVNGDGSWTFDPGQSAYQSLGVGSHQVLSVPVTVTDGHGGSDRQDLVITVVGSNDGPQVGGSVTLAGGREDHPVQITSAALLGQATDVDLGDHLGVSGLSVDHGSIHANADGSYTLIPELNYTGAVQLSYQVTDGAGGSAPAHAVVTLSPTGDAAVIGGADRAGVTEDLGVDAAGSLTVSGDLSVTDPDAGEAVFAGATLSGGHGGTLVIGTDGHWSYAIDNSLAAVQGLAVGETLSERFTVHSADGTGHVIVATVEGRNDVPTLAAATASTQEGDAVVSGQMVGGDVDHGDQLGFAAAGPLPAGLVMNGDGSWTFDPTDAAYNALGVGQSQVLTVPVTVTDSAGASATNTLTLTISGR
ncbi:VCBS domain-containing protein, partial [Falsiruegeria litorea]